MKRTILKKLTACLCLCAVLSGTLTVPAGAASFQDVPSNHWAATAIDRCAANGTRDWSVLNANIKSDLSGYLFKTTKRNPMILPVIMEI